MAWADRLVFVYPTSWGCRREPEAVLEMTFTPGFAYKYQPPRGRRVVWDKLLAGRSAGLLVPMDSPPVYYSRLIGEPGFKAMKRTILGFCGIDPVHKHYFGSRCPPRRNGPPGCTRLAPSDRRSSASRRSSGAVEVGEAAAERLGARTDDTRARDQLTAGTGPSAGSEHASQCLRHLAWWTAAGGGPVRRRRGRSGTGSAGAVERSAWEPMPGQPAPPPGGRRDGCRPAPGCCWWWVRCCSWG